MIPSTTLSPKGVRIRRNLVRVAVIVVAVNVLVVTLGLVFDAEGPSPGPDGSSFVTTPRGSSALAGVLERLDRTVTRSREPFEPTSLEEAGVVVAIDVDAAQYSAPELNALDRFVRSGGTLLVAGRTDLMSRIVNDSPEWRAEGAAEATFGSSAEDRLTLELSGFGSLEDTEGEIVLATGSKLVVAVRRELGEGQLIWWADSGPFHNRLIGEADNAVALVTTIPTEGPIVFDELRHGYATDAGLWASLPDRVRTMLWLLGATLVVGLIAYGRRFGPPHDLVRRMPPGREEYLDAVGGMIHRAGGTSDSLALIRHEAIRRLEERYGHLHDFSLAGAEAGLDHDLIEALLGDTNDDATLLDADRALAILSTKETNG